MLFVKAKGRKVGTQPALSRSFVTASMGSTCNIALEVCILEVCTVRTTFVRGLLAPDAYNAVVYIVVIIVSGC